MSSTPLHLMAVIGLAIGFGAALTMALQVQTAGAYPAGPSISTGSNPIVSAGGSFEGPGSEAALSAPDDQDLIITDVMLGLPQSNEYCRGNGTVHLRDGAGNSYGEFAVGTTHMGNAQATPTVFHARSGLRVPAGTSITLSWTWDYNYCGTSTYDLVYTLGGYLAQP